MELFTFFVTLLTSESFSFLFLNLGHIPSNKITYCGLSKAFQRDRNYLQFNFYNVRINIHGTIRVFHNIINSRI